MAWALGCRRPRPCPHLPHSVPRARPSCCSLGRAAPWSWPLCQRGAPRCCWGPLFCGGDTYVLGPCSSPSLWFAVACNIAVKPRGTTSQLHPAGEDRAGPTESGGTPQPERPRPWSWTRACLAVCGQQSHVPPVGGSRAGSSRSQGRAASSWGPSSRAVSPPPGSPRSRPTWTQGGDTDPTSSWGKWQRIHGRGLKLPLGSVSGDTHGRGPNGLCLGSASTSCCPYMSRGPRDGDPTYSGPAVDTGQLPGPRQDVSPQHRDLVGLCTAVPQLHTHSQDPNVC